MQAAQVIAPPSDFHRSGKWPEGFNELGPDNYRGYDFPHRPISYERATYMKFAVCHTCQDIVPAGKPVDGAYHFNKCECGATKFAYTDEWPDNNTAVISGPATLLGVLQEEWDELASPKGNDRRIMVQMMTIMRSSSSIIDMDADESAKASPIATHYNVVTKAPVAILAQTDQEVTILYTKTMVRHNVKRMAFYQNYAPMDDAVGVA